MLHCTFCGTAVADVDAAIEADWLPSYYDGEWEVGEPVCPSCAEARLQLSDLGEYVLAEHNRYADEAEAAQRASDWPQAASLWQAAGDLCDEVGRRTYYRKQAEWCRRAAENGASTDS